MQVINRGATNTLVFTLTENTTLSGPKYLFELTSKGDTNPYCFIAQDISSYPDRYNKFTVLEVSGTATGEDKLNGKILLTQNGEYAYRVFEQTSATNLDPALSDNQTPLEEGIITVIGTASEKIYYSPTHQDGKVYASGK